MDLNLDRLEIEVQIGKRNDLDDDDLEASCLRRLSYQISGM